MCLLFSQFNTRQIAYTRTHTHTHTHNVCSFWKRYIHIHYICGAYLTLGEFRTATERGAEKGITLRLTSKWCNPLDTHKVYFTMMTIRLWFPNDKLCIGIISCALWAIIACIERVDCLMKRISLIRLCMLLAVLCLITYIYISRVPCNMGQ